VLLGRSKSPGAVRQKRSDAPARLTAARKDLRKKKGEDGVGCVATSAIKDRVCADAIASSIGLEQKDKLGS